MQNTTTAPYKKLALILFISFVIMYIVMFFNVDEFSHIYLSYTRLYMTLLMISPMALLMLGMMRNMYSVKKLNSIITISSIALFVFALTALRSQAFIGNLQYMKAMIPSPFIGDNDKYKCQYLRP